MKRIRTMAATAIIMTGGLILFAYRGTWGKSDILFRIHINQELVQASTFGEVPTFSIWLEEPESGVCQTVFVTRRAAEGDWEGKAEVPAALPLWFEIYKKESETEELPNIDHPAPLAVTGATPEPGFFTTRVRVDPESKWVCWIEMNLAGDYNEFYLEYDQDRKTVDEYGTGQPALVYRATLEATEGITVVPEIIGMSFTGAPDGKMIQPLRGITTAVDVFDSISISVVRPNPKIMN